MAGDQYAIHIETPRVQTFPFLSALLSFFAARFSLIDFCGRFLSLLFRLSCDLATVNLP
jgi:hypothetical protein